MKHHDGYKYIIEKILNYIVTLRIKGRCHVEFIDI